MASRSPERVDEIQELIDAARATESALEAEDQAAKAEPLTKKIDRLTDDMPSTSARLSLSHLHVNESPKLVEPQHSQRLPLHSIPGPTTNRRSVAGERSSRRPTPWVPELQASKSEYYEMVTTRVYKYAKCLTRSYEDEILDAATMVHVVDQMTKEVARLQLISEAPVLGNDAGLTTIVIDNSKHSADVDRLLAKVEERVASFAAVDEKL